jgi:hypothetical protein
VVARPRCLVNPSEKALVKGAEHRHASRNANARIAGEPQENSPVGVRIQLRYRQADRVTNSWRRVRGIQDHSPGLAFVPGLSKARNGDGGARLEPPGVERVHRDAVAREEALRLAAHVNVAVEKGLARGALGRASSPFHQPQESQPADPRSAGTHQAFGHRLGRVAPSGRPGHDTRRNRVALAEGDLERMFREAFGHEEARRRAPDAHARIPKPTDERRRRQPVAQVPEEASGELVGPRRRPRELLQWGQHAEKALTAFAGGDGPESCLGVSADGLNPIVRAQD